jgi:hypothetical protein
VRGEIEQIFQAEVWPMPISDSPTQADFLPLEIAWPKRPETLSSFVVWRKRGIVEPRVGLERELSWTYLNVKHRIETYRQMPLIILGEQA